MSSTCRSVTQLSCPSRSICVLKKKPHASQWLRMSTEAKNFARRNAPYLTDMVSSQRFWIRVARRIFAIFSRRNRRSSRGSRDPPAPPPPPPPPPTPDADAAVAAGAGGMMSSNGKIDTTSSSSQLRA